MATPAPAVKKTAIATLNSNLAASIERLNNSQVAVGLASDGSFVNYINTNYINTASSIKHSVVILDSQIKSIEDTRYTITEVDDKFTALIGGAPSTLDTLKEIADALNSDASAKTTLSNQITAESTRAGNAEAKLTSDLAAEVTRAQEAEADLVADLSAEYTRATGIETTLGSSLSAEVTRSTNADTTQTNNITSEVNARISAVSTLQGNLTTLLTDNYNALDGAIAAEESRATGVENTLTGNLSAEITRATGAETTLTGNLNAEITRAQDAEEELASDLAAEKTRAEGAEDALDTRLDTIEASYIKKDGSVAFTDDLDMANHRVTNVADPVLDQDAATKLYVDSKILNLGSVFEYVGTVAAPLNLDTLNASHAGVYYRVTAKGTLTYGTSGSISANIGDGVVFNKAGEWDLIDNTDAVVLGTSGRIALSGDANNGYYVDIASDYVGQASINTVGTISSGAWKASVVDVPYGGTSHYSYDKGDLLIGNASAGLSKLAVGPANTILRSNGTDASWVVADTEHVALTSVTNFAGLSQLQQALDFLYNNTQIRKFAQHEIVSSAALTAAAATDVIDGKFQSGKVLFVNYDVASPKIYLPASSANVFDGSVFRIVHNGAHTDGNLQIAYKDANDVEHIILELAPKDSISCVWNGPDGMYMFAVGI